MKELLDLARERKDILVTCDKDFLYISKSIEDSIILIDIHPLIDENVLPSFDNLLKVISPTDLAGNFIILYQKNYKIKRK